MALIQKDMACTLPLRSKPHAIHNAAAVGLIGSWSSRRQTWQMRH